MRNVANRLSALIVVVLLFITPSSARVDEIADTAFQQLYKEYLQLYASTDQDAEFYTASRQMMDYLLEQDELVPYFKIYMNEVLYDTEHNHAYEAIEKANRMLDDMKARKVARYDLVYLALGTVFESRGNTKMAEYYFNEALNNLDDKDEGSLMGLYSRMAFLFMLKKPLEAKRWNDKYYEASANYPPYRQVYYFLEAVINFAVGNKYDFDKVYDTYHDYRDSHDMLDDYGLQTLEAMRLAFDKRYNEALAQLADGNTDINSVAMYDIRTRIYEMQGDYRQALATTRRQAEVIDSLNSDMLFDNLNEINAQAGIAKMQAKASEDQSRLLLVVVLLSLAVIGALVYWIYNRSRMRQHLLEKNEQLSTALKMAEESDRMKTEFVRSVSHEIRTPLNAIAGFSEIVTDGSIQLSDEERLDLIARIKENTQSITKIVDELLNMAQKESSTEYERNADVYCNQFFSDILYQNRGRVSSSIELKYTTKVINRFTIRTNADAVRTILEHLVQNAIKFTTRGTIEMNCVLREADQMLLVSVSDTGRGVSPDKRQKIFEQFYKEDSFQQGIGLGLTVSRMMAQKLGGDLMLDEDYTSGARFVLSLPAQGA